MSVPFASDSDFAALKVRVLSILDDNNGAMGLTELCKSYKALYGRNIRSISNGKAKVPKDKDLFINFLSDVVSVDTSDKNKVVIRKGSQASATAFSHAAKQTSSKSIQRELTQSQKHVIGTSQAFAIPVDDEEPENMEIIDLSVSKIPDNLVEKSTSSHHMTGHDQPLLVSQVCSSRSYSELAKDDLERTPDVFSLLGSTAGKPIDVNQLRSSQNSHVFTTLDFPAINGGVLQGRARPTMSDLNEFVNQIRSRISREGNLVRLTEIVSEICTFYNVSRVAELRPVDRHWLQRETEIPAITELLRLQGKINAYIHAFIAFHSICTLHELEVGLCSMEGKETFIDFKVGPLQKQPLVYEYFQFPHKCKIPSITTVRVLNLLWSCLSKRRSASQKEEHGKLQLKTFMEFLIKEEGLSDPYESGVRIGSMGLAVQMVKKNWHENLHEVKNCLQKFAGNVINNLNMYLQHSHDELVGKNPRALPGDPENLVQRLRGSTFLNICSTIYGYLQKMKYQASLELPASVQFIQFADLTMNTLLLIEKDKLMSTLFHVLMSVSALKVLDLNDLNILRYLGLESTVKELMSNTQDVSKSVVRTSSNKKQTSKEQLSKGRVTGVCKKWIQKAAEGTLNLEVLSRLESKITLEVSPQACSFDELGHGAFLKFICKDPSIKALLGNNIGAGMDNNCGGKVDIVSLKDFVRLCNHKSKEEILNALSAHYGYMDMSMFSYVLEEPVGTRQAYSNIIYLQAVLCGGEQHDIQYLATTKVEQFTETAKRAVLSAPYLRDIADWLSWDMLYAPKLGSLQKFMRVHLNGVFSEFVVLEVTNGRFLKILRDCPEGLLADGLCRLSAYETVLAITSVVCSSGNVADAPLALLGNQVLKKLLELSRENSDKRICEFCLDCMVLIPQSLLVTVVQKVFLNPLNEMYGGQNVSTLLLCSCLTEKHRQVLHVLGHLLGRNEWKEDESVMWSEHVNKHIILEPGPGRVSEEVIVEMHTEQDIEASVDVDMVDCATDPAAEVEGNIHDSSLLAAEGMLAVNEGAELIDLEEATQSLSSELHLASSCKTHEAADLMKIPVSSGEDAIISSNPAEVRRLACRHYIETIRREQFGVGIELGEAEEKLFQIYCSREGRSLDRLSNELYTKDSHFVLELIQNADDNDYSSDVDSDSAEEHPTLAFLVESDKITIFNNEIGFQEKHISALCDVGKSTKAIHRKGYIGQKGIGFKSVFRVTRCPEVHSNGYHIRFNADSGPNGHILPHWIDVPLEQESIEYQPPGVNSEITWRTKIVLPLKDDVQHSKLASRFHDIHPSLLMFLNRLQAIIIDDRVSGSCITMDKKKLSPNILQLSVNKTESLWFVITKELDIDVRENIKTTDVSLAFPIASESCQSAVKEVLPAQHVFAFLPLRSYGFKFIIQADFEVPSSREDIDKDSPWNQFILQHIPKLVAEAFHCFKTHPYYSSLEGAVKFFQFMDLTDHVLGIFKPVAQNILKQLQREECIPVEMEPGANDEWCLPNAAVLARPEQQLVITPHMLQRSLGLQYANANIHGRVSKSVLNALGIRKLSLEQLLEIGKSYKATIGESGGAEVLHLHRWIGKWLALLAMHLHDTHDCSQLTYNAIKMMPIYPLSDGTFVALADTVVFFPVDGEANRPKAKKGKSISALGQIERDLSILSREILADLDDVQRPLVVKMLKELGVKSLTPGDLIQSHILPQLQSTEWQKKSADLIVAFVVYMKEQWDLDNLNSADIANCVVVMTNKGLLRPSENRIYLTPVYKNLIDLKQCFPNVDWSLISDAYVRKGFTDRDVLSWQEFFSEVGLLHFPSLKRDSVKLHKSDLPCSPWSVASTSWPPVEEDTYVIDDVACPEFGSLLAAQNGNELLCFAVNIDRRWESEFSKHDLEKMCVVKNVKGDAVDMAYSSFCLQLRLSKWLCDDSGSGAVYFPKQLFCASHQAKSLLGDHCKFLTDKISNRSFIKFLGVKEDVSFNDFIVEFKKWVSEESFVSPKEHVVCVYEYIFSRVRDYPSEIRQLVDGPLVYLPLGNSTTGKFYSKHQVCWEDRSGVIGIRDEDIGQRRLLHSFYPAHLRDFFVLKLGVDREPNVREYINALVSVCKKAVLPDQDACAKIYSLFAVLGEKCVESASEENSHSWRIPDKLEDFKAAVDDMEVYFVDTAVAYLRSKDVALEKVFPTASDAFACISDGPVLSDSRHLAEIFGKCDAVKLIDLERIRMTISNALLPSDSRLRRQEQHKSELKFSFLVVFLRACGFEWLSDTAEQPEVDPVQIFQHCEPWEQRLHEVTPVIQRFLCHKRKDVYERMKKDKFKDFLLSSKFFTAKELRQVYRLRGKEANVSVPKKCAVQRMQGKAFVYIAASSADEKSHREDIYSDLMTLFAVSDEALRSDLFEFVVTYVSIGDKEKESFLRRQNIANLLESDERWVYPYAKKIDVPPPKPATTAKDAVSREKAKEDGGLTCWPPKPPLVGRAEESRAASDGLKQEIKELEEKWKPPERPIKDLVKDLDSSGETGFIAHHSQSASNAMAASKSVGPAVSPSNVSAEKISGNDGRADAGKRKREPSSDQPPLNASVVGAEGSGENPMTPVTKKVCVPEAGNVESRSPDLVTTPMAAGTPHEFDRKDSQTAARIKTESSAGATSAGRSIHSREHAAPLRFDPSILAQRDVDGHYEDLTICIDIDKLGTRPAVVVQGPETMPNDLAVGRCGEEIVFRQLCKIYESDIAAGRVTIIWLNDSMETGEPYDIKVCFAEAVGMEPVYIEVKSTMHREKNIFEISPQQLRFAFDKGASFHLFRVSGLASQSDLKVQRLVNLSMYMDNKSVKVYLLL